MKGALRHRIGWGTGVWFLKGQIIYFGCVQTGETDTPAPVFGITFNLSTVLNVKLYFYYKSELTEFTWSALTRFYCIWKRMTLNNGI
jgi:hypothetical protein